MLFSSTSAFLAVILVALIAVLVISRWARTSWKPIAVCASVICSGLLLVGVVARANEQKKAQAQLRNDTRFVAETVVQAEQQQLKRGGFRSISYHGRVSVEVTAIDGTHAAAHVWSQQASFRFKLTPHGATPSP